MIKWRAEKLVEKMLSIKFVIFIAATVLRCFEVIGCGEWLTIALVVIAGREALKWKGSRFEVLGNEESLGSD